MLSLEFRVILIWI